MSLDGETLDQLVSMEAESSEYPDWKEAHATKRSRQAAKAFTAALHNALFEWADAGPTVRSVAPVTIRSLGHLPVGFTDPEEASDALMEAEGAYLVFMTLEGAGVGIWDGRWDDFYSRDELGELGEFLKRKLRGEIKGGVFYSGHYDDLKRALEEDAYETGGGAETEEESKGASERARAFRWPVRIEGLTHRPSGRPSTIDRTVEGGDSTGVEHAVLRALASRPDRGRPFVGDSITITTPDGSYCRIVEEERAGRGLEGLVLVPC